MTDIDYIKGFRENDSRIINKFYDELESDFKQKLGKKLGHYNDDVLTDIFQEAVVRLWENVKRGRLNEANLTGSLAGYLYRIGEFVIYEMFRKNREVHMEHLGEYNAIALNDTTSYQIDWIEQVEIPYERFVRETCKDGNIEQWNELVQKFNDLHKTSIPVYTNQSTDSEEIEILNRIECVVDNMGLPCAPLLKYYYWENFSMEQISVKLGYKNADSVKTQKNKCMNKIKAAIKGVAN